MSETKKSKVLVQNRKDLSMLTFVPLQPSWLAFLPAYQSSDAQVVRASVNLLMAAFYGQPCATIPSTIEALATLSHTPKSVVAENLTLLKEGWKVSGSTMTFVPMQEFAKRLNADQADALERLQHATIVAMAAPDLFSSELLPAQGATLTQQVAAGLQKQTEPFLLAPTKVPRLLPEGAGLSQELVSFLDRLAVSADMHQAIWDRFYDYHASKGMKSPNWPASFRNWYKNQQEFSRTIAVGAHPEAQVLRATKTARISFSQNMGESRGERAANHTRHALESVGAKMSASNPTLSPDPHKSSLRQGFSFDAGVKQKLVEDVQ